MPSINSLLGLSPKENFQALFDKHSTVVNGNRILTKDAFSDILKATHTTYPISQDHVDLFFRSADSGKLGVLTNQDFVDFEQLLLAPDAEYKVISRLIGYNGKSTITADQIKQFFLKSDSSVNPIDFNSEQVKLLIGSGKKTVLYKEFCQFIKSIREEKLKSFFKYHDPKQTGRISPDDAMKILYSLGGYSNTSPVAKHLTVNNTAITYPELVALSNVLSKLDVIKEITSEVAKHNNQTVDLQNFTKTAASSLSYESFSGLEIAMLFHLVGTNSVLPATAFEPLFNPTFVPSTPQNKVRLSAAMETLKSVYNFSLGSIAGALGAFAVYPIDLVKTRMQNQRSQVVGQVLYKNGFDCFKKVIRNEGVLGLYSGLLPQLVGVAPEKAIKLTMNDLVRSRMKNQETGEIPIAAEVLAGMTAGGSQVLFTNPLEIVKIRLQVQGEVAKSGIEGAPPRMGAIGIVRQLGLFGLYKGVGACLLRDIPFSGIFFPVYAHLKKDVFHEGINGKRLSIPELLISGALAGMPAAYLVTPADVIKTRLQVAARKGETTYSGISDAFSKILREEGPRAFFKGGIARILRSSPQFGVTLASYELLQNFFNVDFGDGSSSSNVFAKSNFTPVEIGQRNTLRRFTELSLKP
ncbi:mitochondrial carrier domain-containing protein [Globomyces pollinis-pini]|nr:mitochondrial carrier domain-containing protein [Globomyces pollinis-pini]